MEPIEMRRHRLPLDELTAARLAAGELDPADAPPGYAATALLLTQARAGLDEGEIDAGLLAAMVDAVDASPADTRTRSMRSKLRSAKVATAAAALLLTTGGAAAAATGSLPDPAQDAIADVAERVGLDLPTSAEDHPTGNTDNPTDSDDHGVEVSDVARNSELTGREHGAAVSETARAGHGSDASDDEDEDETEGTDETERGRPEDPGSQAPVDTPSSGGTGTAGDASGGNSDVGAAHADLGAGNADDNPGTTHRP